MASLRRTKEDEDKAYFRSCIKRMSEEDENGTKRLPPFKIIKYHDFLEKLWGWNKLVPMGISVSWSAYIHYLEAYYDNTNSAAKSLSIAVIAETCCKKEEQLVSEWKIRKESKVEMTLPMSKSIIQSCLIQQQCKNSAIHTANCKSSAVSSAALWCINNEAVLTHELLRRGAHPCNGYLMNQSSEIRMCALSLMNCTLQNSGAACAAAMLGIAEEAQTMCEWMGKNNSLLDLYDDPIPDAMIESRIVRFRTLDVMYEMLLKSATGTASDGGGGHMIDVEAANNAGGGISHILNSLYQKTGGKKNNKRKRNKDDVLGNLHWERLLLLYGSVEWSNYCNCLADYYDQNAYKFLADAVSEQNLEDSGSSLAAVVANRCLKMEEELVSMWMARVPRCRDNTSSFSTVIQSSLVKARAHAIRGTESEFSASSAIAFMCISMEADLMCELLKRGAKPIDHIIQQSNVIRMCALGLVSLEGQQAIASAAAMVGIAKETKRMSDWVKRQNKLLTGLELDCGRVIRTRTLDVMTSILLSSFQPEVQQ